MTNGSDITANKIINSKRRIKDHGEVFTPERTINKMLDLPNIREACQNLTATFLEPAAGEGAFLVEILKRKLQIVVKNYSESIQQFENYSLLALSTLYGVELLEDNAQKCAINMYEQYYKTYHKQVKELETKMKQHVLDSAKLIISQNIAQGNFLTKQSADDTPIVFSEWKPVQLRKKSKTITVQRTEYTLDEIFNIKKKTEGERSAYSRVNGQLSIYDLLEFNVEEETTLPKKNYVPVKITNVYQEEMEDVNG